MPMGDRAVTGNGPEQRKLKKRDCSREGNSFKGDPSLSYPGGRGPAEKEILAERGKEKGWTVAQGFPRSHLRKGFRFP